jgi:penicillin-binding protein 1B
MLKDVVNRGTAARLGARGFKNVSGKTAFAGKTGTSRDGWFAGYTPNIVCIVWVGFDDGSQLGLKGADSALPIWADFMTAALDAHPEWNGDWQMPNGVRQEQIDTTTGKLATEETVTKRTELFISGTGPVGESEVPVDEMATPDSTDGDELPATPPSDALPELPPPRSRPIPKLEGRGVQQGDGTTRLEGTITLDIDPTTGLIAAPTCPIIRSKTFVIGQEPRENCGPQYHNGSLPKPPPRHHSSSP